MANPSYWTTLTAAQATHRAGDFAGAIKGYREAIRAGIESGQSIGFFLGEAHLGMGLACRAANQLEQALTCHQTLESLAQEKIKPLERHLLNLYYYWGCTLYAQGDIEAGIAAHRRLFQRLFTPDTPQDYAPRAIHPRDLQAAIEDCDRADARFCRGLAKRAQGDWAGAAFDLQAASEQTLQDSWLKKWAQTAHLLQRGFVSPHARETLQPGVEYVYFEHNEESRSVIVLQFALDTPMIRGEYPLAESAQIHAHYKQDEAWVLMRRQNHQEGHSYYYWRWTD